MKLQIYLYKYMRIYTFNKNLPLQIFVQVKNIQFMEETNQPMCYCTFRSCGDKQKGVFEAAFASL